MGLGGLWWSNVLNSVIPPQRLWPDTRLEHQDPVTHTAQKKRKKKKKEKNNNKKKKRATKQINKSTRENKC